MFNRYNRRTLDNRYFEYLTEKHSGHFRYEAYRPIGRPMILFSLVDGSPLASLTFRSQDSPGNDGKCVISKRPSNGDFKCDFQGLIDKDDQEFELVITNLSDKGFINFNIMKKDESVDTVNPGGLNEINELRPNESYAVRCDQADNRSLILTTMTKSDGKSKVSIAEDEHEAAEKKEQPKGTYYYLSVVPQLNEENLVKRFERTQWACVDVFYRQIRDESPQVIDRGFSLNAPMIPRRRTVDYGNDVLLLGEPEGSLEFQSDELAMPTRERSKGFTLMSGKHGRTKYISNVGQSLRNTNRQLRSDPAIPEVNIGPWRTPGQGPEGSIGAPGPIGIRGPPGPVGQNFFEAGSMNISSAGYSMNTSSAAMIGSGLPRDFTPVGPVPRQPAAFAADNQPAEDIIMTSQAANVRGGRHIQVNSAQTGIEYAYDKMSNPCVIGLSVAPGLHFHPDPSHGELIELVMQMIDSHITNETSQLLEMLERKYEEKNCCICLEEAPNVIFYQCGHQCTHRDCAKSLPNHKCPLCRSYITAEIPTNLAA